MNQVFRSLDVLLDKRSGRALRAGAPLVIEPRTFDVLVYLMERPGELVTHAQLLDAVWGDVNVTPHSLTQAISQVRRALEDSGRAPKFVQTVHRKGYRWIAPVRVDERPPVSKDLPGSLAPWRVPARVTSLIGREELVERVSTQLQQARLVALVGPGGVGKTQLALEVGRRVEQSFQDGALIVDLTPEHDSSGIELAISRTLRLAQTQRESVVDALTTALRDRHLLLVLDNCEHIAEACGSLAFRLICAAPRVHILATTQQPLHVQGEVLVRVPPLAVPTADWGPSRTADRGGWPASVRLFVERASTTHPGFDLTSANAPAVCEICRRLDGLPLALELAAARVNVLTPAQIAERLDHRFQLLERQRHNDPPRHHTLAATVDWSINLLPERTRGILQHLSVFSGGWTLDAAQSVIDGGRDARLIDELATLVDRSLVIADVNRTTARYALPETIRSYTTQYLVRASEFQRLRDRHLQHFCAFAQRAGSMFTTEPADWLRRVREESANIRTALDWALDANGDAEAGLRLACDLRWVWRTEGNYTESRDCLTRALMRAEHAPDVLVGRAQIALGLILHHRAEFESARAAIELGLSQLPPEESWERAFGAILLSFNETLGGTLEHAESLAKDANKLLRPLNDDTLSAFALIRAGVAAGLKLDHHAAARTLTEACRLLGRGQDPFLLAYGGINLGLQRYLAGEPSRARKAFLDALEAAYALDNVRAIAGNIEGFAYLAVGEHDYRWAARLLGAAARLRETTAAPLFPHWRDAHHRATAAIGNGLGSVLASRELRAGADTPLAHLVESLRADD